MTREEVKTKICNIIGETLGVPATDILDTDKMVDNLGIDSLDAIEMIMEIEKEFGISIPDEEANKLSWEATVEDIIKYVTTKLN
jgi:acyl carrier protein